MSTPMRWRKSSRSLENNCVEVGWRKSSHSGEINCVEVAAIAIRDSKNPGLTLRFPAARLAAFLRTLGDAPTSR